MSIRAGSTRPRRESPRLGAVYRRVFIVDSRDWFDGCRDLFDPQADLVLTYDFALRREIEALGGTALYVDHLVDREVMQENNFRAYEFFRTWHIDSRGEDLFSFRGVPFGFSFRIDYWNEYIFYLRARLCLEQLRDVGWDSIHAGTDLGLVESILEEMGIPFEPVPPAAAAVRPLYYFPIHRWLRENIRRTGLRGNVINWCAWALGTAFSWVDRMRGKHKRPGVFVQEYHPTQEMIKRLRNEGRVRVIATDITRTQLWSRYVPLFSRPTGFRDTAAAMIARFRAGRVARLVLTGDLDVTEAAYRIIEQSVSSRLLESLATLSAVIRYCDHNSPRLELLIANIGPIVPLVDCVCRARGIPSYLIINGMMALPFLDEAKYATVINAYSRSIKENYFRDMTNIVCLGDPRMDRYPPTVRPKANPDAFTVAIGGSGHSNIDLNSYVAAEFDFLDEVLQALRQVKRSGVALQIIVKVRANGYSEQYRQFVAEYHSDLAMEIVDQVSMASVLGRADFYISTYSQTLFEASCMGIPSLYYRSDAQVMDPPFDGASELVTVDSVDDLVVALNDFRAGHPRFDAFLQRSVMEQYIGPLDGMNLQRNLDFFYGMLSAGAGT